MKELLLAAAIFAAFFVSPARACQTPADVERELLDRGLIAHLFESFDESESARFRALTRSIDFGSRSIVVWWVPRNSAFVAVGFDASGCTVAHGLYTPDMMAWLMAAIAGAAE